MVPEWQVGRHRVVDAMRDGLRQKVSAIVHWAVGDGFCMDLDVLWPYEKQTSH